MSISLFKALTEQMENEYTALAYLTGLLEEEGIKYSISPENHKIKISFYSNKSRNGIFIRYTIETTSKGYKLTAHLNDWQNNVHVDFKTVERVYAETIVENFIRIDENLPKYINGYFEEKADWEQRRKQLHKDEVLKELMAV